MSLPSILSTVIDLLNELDEEQEMDEDMLLACLLIGEFLSEKDEKPIFYVRNRIEWERHIADLTVEGNDAFNY